MCGGGGQTCLSRTAILFAALIAAARVGGLVALMGGRRGVDPWRHSPFIACVMIAAAEVRL